MRNFKIYASKIKYETDEEEVVINLNYIYNSLARASKKIKILET